MSGAQLVAVPLGREHAYAIERHAHGLRRLQGGEAQPLPGGRMAILHPGVAHVACLATEQAREPRRHVQGGEPALLDPKKRVLALAARKVSGQLFDEKAVGA
jgi:hypothetical protein